MDLPSCLRRGRLGDEDLPVELRCSCDLTGHPFEFHAPECDRISHPHLDGDTLALVGDALESLVCFRGSWTGDAGAVLSCLASLIAEVQAALPDTVADARDQDLSWAEIATRLDSTASTVRRRYGSYARWRRTDEGRVIALGDR